MTDFDLTNRGMNRQSNSDGIYRANIPNMQDFYREKIAETEAETARMRRALTGLLIIMAVNLAGIALNLATWALR